RRRAADAATNGPTACPRARTHHVADHHAAPLVQTVGGDLRGRDPEGEEPAPGRAMSAELGQALARLPGGGVRQLEADVVPVDRLMARYHPAPPPGATGPATRRARPAGARRRLRAALYPGERAGGWTARRRRPGAPGPSSGGPCTARRPPLCRVCATRESLA